MKLHDYPAAIETAQLAILSLSERISVLKDLIADSDFHKMESILDARTAENKPTFTNEQQRAAALKRLQDADEQHRFMTDSLRELESLRAKKQFALGRLQNEFSIAKLDKREQIINREATQ